MDLIHIGGLFVKSSKRPYAITPRKCGIVPTFAQHGWIQSSSELLCDLW
jgi:hypothetical protein